MSERTDLTKFDTIESIDQWECKIHDILKYDIAFNKILINFPTDFDKYDMIHFITSDF